MRYTAKCRNTGFSITWFTLRIGQPSVDHHAVMPMTTTEHATFAKMQREQRVEEVTERWMYSIGEGTF